MTAPLAVVLTALAAAGCGGAGPREGVPVPPELKLEGVKFRLYRGDVLRAYGEAESASLRRDSTELRANALHAVLPRSSTPVHVTAPMGEGTLGSQVYQASGGVVVSRGDDVARTERARYAPAAGRPEGLVSGEDPVELAGRGYRLTGKGFTLDPAAGTLAIGGGARLVAGLPAGPAAGPGKVTR